MQNRTKKDIAEWSNRRYKECKYICTHIGAPQYIRQLLIAIKGEINSNTKRVGDFITSLSSVETSFRHKINKETLTLNGTLVQIVLIDIYRAFCSKAAEYIFFTSAFETLSKTDHKLDHKVSLCELKKTEIIWSIFSNHNAVRLEKSYKKKYTKPKMHTYAKQYIIKQPIITEEFKEEIENKNKN